MAYGIGKASCPALARKRESEAPNFIFCASYLERLGHPQRIYSQSVHCGYPNEDGILRSEFQPE